MYRVKEQSQKTVLFLNVKGGYSMKNIIEITPDKDGKLFITLYGTRYQIKVKKGKPNETEASNDNNGK